MLIIIKDMPKLDFIFYCRENVVGFRLTLDNITRATHKIVHYLFPYLRFVCVQLNTCDQNVTCCMEIIELNSRLQSQLFRLLGLTSSDGGAYIIITYTADIRAPSDKN